MNLYFFILDQNDVDKFALNWLKDKNLYLTPVHTSDSTRNLVYFTQWTYDILQSSLKRVPTAILPYLKKTNKVRLHLKERHELSKRNQMQRGFPVADLPPADVLEEVDAFLYANPNACVRYLGRGRPEDYPSTHARNFEQKERSRHYWWEVFDNPDQGSLTLGSQTNFQHLRDWFQDPEARVVLSLGSGGLRLFSLIPFLHFLEEEKLIDCLSEIWGCSGGSIAGYLLAHHIHSSVFQNLAYRIHEHSYSKDEIPLATNLRGWLKKFWQSKFWQSTYVQGIIEFSSFTEQMLLEAKTHAPDKATLPFFTLSHNNTLHKNIVLSNQPIEEELQTFMRYLGHEPIKMVTASSAIPLLFKRERIANAAGEIEEWSDGVLFEDTPLASIIRKWSIERRNDPGSVPSKLKIFYVDLGVSLKELFPPQQGSESMNTFVNYSHSFWSRQRTNLEFALNQNYDIEIKGVEMQLGLLGLLNPKLIPSMIHRGYGFFQRELSRINEEIRREKAKPQPLTRQSKAS